MWKRNNVPLIIIDMETHRTPLAITTAVKFLLPSVFAACALRIMNDPRFLLTVLAESALIFLVTDLMAKRSVIASYITGVILLFIVYAQSIVLCFAGRYTQMIMLTNLDSLEALSGKGLLYGSTVALALIALFLPIRYIGSKDRRSMLILCICFIILSPLPLVLLPYSPYANAVSLCKDAIYRKRAEARITRMEELMRDNPDPELAYEEFYSESVGDGIVKPSNLPSDPNIVLIFTEGISRHIISDQRDIMPNVESYMERSLRFEDYYDHTAATLRGLIGQLYSAHQYNNLDSNRLVSIQEILASRGYDTVFVNPEPNNEPFTAYLATFDFEKLTSGDITDRPLTDGETYDLVYRELSEGIEQGNPVFIAVYTYGTHVSLDLGGEEFGDGSNHLLNRFRSSDAAFGDFMSRLGEAGLADDTIIIYTADHATYTDDDYVMSFDNPRTDCFCDTIPFFIYYEGIEPQVLDAQGRNSLDLVPTILDYIDVDASNFFLGSSLFLPARDPFMETVFCVPDSGWQVKTDGDELRDLTWEEATAYMDRLTRYFALAR